MKDTAQSWCGLASWDRHDGAHIAAANVHTDFCVGLCDHAQRQLGCPWRAVPPGYQTGPLRMAQLPPCSLQLPRQLLSRLPVPLLSRPLGNAPAPLQATPKPTRCCCWHAGRICMFMCMSQALQPDFFMGFCIVHLDCDAAAVLCGSALLE